MNQRHQLPVLGKALPEPEGALQLGASVGLLGPQQQHLLVCDIAPFAQGAPCQPQPQLPVGGLQRGSLCAERGRIGTQLHEPEAQRESTVVLRPPVDDGPQCSLPTRRRVCQVLLPLCQSATKQLTVWQGSESNWHSLGVSSLAPPPRKENGLVLSGHDASNCAGRHLSTRDEQLPKLPPCPARLLQQLVLAPPRKRSHRFAQTHRAVRLGVGLKPGLKGGCLRIRGGGTRGRLVVGVVLARWQPQSVEAAQQ